VEDVVPATPAAKANLKVGDLIKSINGQPIADDLDLIRYISGQPAEAVVTIAYERGGIAARPGRRAEVKVPLSKKQLENGRPPLAEVTDPGWRGMKVEFATAAPLFRERCRDLDQVGCVGVIEVERDSPAWKAGFRPGDFVSHVGALRVTTPREFYAAAEKASGEVKLKLTVVDAEKAIRTVIDEPR
jgi:serine protease Do